MQNWCNEKLESLTQEFLTGHGHPLVFEAQYLAYLEVREVHWHGPDGGQKVWSRFRENGPFGPQSTDRKELVEALRKFKRQFDGPRKVPVAISPQQSVSIFDLFEE